MSSQDQPRPAHRPSRRAHIIDAAIQVFATAGYGEASIEDIARAAGVAPTAVYYHFGGKDELFTEALRAALDGFSEQIVAARSDDVPGDTEGLRRIVRAGWEWWRTHPAASRLVGRYSESSAPHAQEVRLEWEERHLERAFAYVAPVKSARPTRRARELHATHSLAIRVMLDVILVSQAAFLDAGPLKSGSKVAVGAAVEDMCVMIIETMD